MSYFEYEGSHIFYEVKGTGKPLLLGHSYLWDSSMWDESITILSTSFTCVCVDLPGHGRSQGLKDITLDKLADLNRAVMSELGFEKFSIAGLSIGGMWGAELCKFPEVTVDHLILLNTALTPEPEGKKELYLSMLSTIEERGFIPENIINLIAPGFFSPETAGDLLEDFKERLRNTDLQKINTIVEVGRAFVNRGLLLSHLQSFKEPVLVIAGANDLYRSLDEAEAVKEYTGGELKIIPAGHISAVEIPEVVAKIIIKFINS